MMRRVTRGLGSLLVLAALLVGLPAVLLSVGAQIVPTHLDTTTLLNRILSPDNSGTTLVWLVTAAAWLAWIVFLVLTVLEVINLATDHRLNLHVPGLGNAQQLVGALMMAAITLGAAPTAAIAAPTDTTSAAAAAAGKANMPTASSSHTVHRVTRGESMWQIAQDYYGDGDLYPLIAAANHINANTPLEVGQKLTIPARGATTAKPTTVTISGNDSLWSLAKTHLGDGERWTEIYQANRAAIGSNPNVLPDGLVLTIPTTTHKPTKTPAAPTTHTTPAASASTANTTPHAPNTAQNHTTPTGAARPITVTQPPASDNQPPTSTIGTPALPQTAPTAPTSTARPAASPPATKAPATKAPATKAPAPVDQGPATVPVVVTQPVPHASVQSSASVQHSAEASPAPLPTEGVGGVVGQPAAHNREVILEGVLAGAGILLTSSLIATINRRRRRQLRERQPGEAIVLPDEDAQRTETTLRRTPVPATVAHLDVVLRAIGEHCLAHELPLPVLSAARLASDRIDLLLVEPHTQVPQWCHLTADATVWTIYPNDTEELALRGEDLTDQVPAPWPALVSIGHDSAEALILINLETAGALTITADDDADARDAMRALALELALGPFSADLNLTLVGDTCPGLDVALDEPTLTRVASVDELIASLAERAQLQRTLLAGQNPSDQRISPQATDGWDPEIILTNQALTEDQASTLADILDTMPRVAIAAVTTIDEDLTPWRYTLAGTPLTGVLQPTDWQLSPLSVTDADYRSVLELLATSRPGTTEPATWWAQDTTLELEAIDPDTTDPDTTDPGTTESAADKTGDAAEQATSSSTSRRQRPSLTTLRVEDITGGKSLDQLWEEVNTAVHSDDAPETTADTDVDDLDDPADDLDEVSTVVAPTRLEPISITRQAAGAQRPYDLVTIPDPTHAPEHPILRVLGPVELLGAGQAPARDRKRALEVLLYLLNHKGTSLNQVARTLGIAPNSTKQVITHLRKWLGTAPDGTPYLPHGEEGGYRLNTHVTSDLHLAETLLAGRLDQVSTDQLVEALNLIHGPAFADVSPAYFAFAEAQRVGIVSRFTDAAIVLTDHALKTGDIALARWAQTKALLLDTDNEALDAARARTEYEAGNFGEVDRIVTQIHAKARRYGHDLCQSTEALLADLKVAR